MKGMVLCILCCLIVSPINGYAQTEPASGTTQLTAEAREFESAVDRYKDDISRLKARRGGVPEVDARVFEFRDNLPSLSAPGLAKVVRENFPQGTAILFYNYDDKLTLRAWVIDHQGIKGFSKSPVSLTEIQTKIDYLRDALGIAKLQLGRAPKKRVLASSAHSSPNAISQAANIRLVFGATENDLGFWTMAEILNAHQKWGIMLDEGRIRTPLKARLAVLSACQTGVGQASKGGVLSLGRTIQASGVPRVVMSLWNVSDDATVSLMELFVSRLQKEVPAEALRQEAMLKTRKDYPSPADWAAFVYFGLPH